MIDKRHGLWVMDINGKNIRKIYPKPKYQSVEWYPDSKHILTNFSKYPDGSKIKPEDDDCLFKYNIDTGDYEKICYIQDVNHFRITPDGKYLYGITLLFRKPAIMPLEGPNKGLKYKPIFVEHDKKYHLPYWWYDVKIDNIEDYLIRRHKRITVKEAIGRSLALNKKK